jgi:ankyrin repeat protein
MSDAIPLPPRPNLEQYKKLARDLQDACKSGDRAAIRGWAFRWVETLARLDGAAIGAKAREYKRAAEGILERWDGLKDTNEHLANCTLAGTQLFIAREHGFQSWPKFAHHLEEAARANSPVSAFEAAADAIVNGDAQTLRRLLDAYPELARQRSTRGHHSALLHYISANGVEDFRQKTPPNIVEIANLLLDAGAEVDAESDAYGGGCTALGLVATSIHPAAAGVQIPLLRTLLDRGARFDQPSAGGNSQSIVHACVANGQPVAAKFFADLGAPVDLESAAVLGRLDLLRTYLDESDTALPHPDRKQMESAFLYACGAGSVAAADFLLDRGADLAAHNEEGQTGLHWAAWGAHIDVIRLLLNRGASVHIRDNRFHAVPLDMALWLWDNTTDKEERERCYEAVALLARSGSKLDRHHWREPQGAGMLGKIDADPRMLAAVRGDLPG